MLQTCVVIERAKACWTVFQDLGEEGEKRRDQGATLGIETGCHMYFSTLNNENLWSIRTLILISLHLPHTDIVKEADWSQSPA